MNSSPVTSSLANPRAGEAPDSGTKQPPPQKLTPFRQRIKNSPIYHLECLRRTLRILAMNATLRHPPGHSDRRGIKIGLVKRGGIGDWILFSPALETLRNGLPAQDTEIVVYTEARTAEIARMIGLADRIVVFDHHAVRKRVRVRHDLLSDVRREAFDVWIDADISRTNIGDAFALASAAPIRIGHAASALERCHARIERRAYTDLLPDETGKVHMSVRFDRLVGHALERAAIAGGGTPVMQQSGLRAYAWQGRESRTLVIAPAASSSSRIWPAERFAELAATLARDHGLRPIVVGGAADAELCNRIASLLAAFDAQSLTGRHTLAGLFDLIRDARLLLTSDSAPMHIGRLTGTPTLAMVSGADFTSYADYPSAPHFAVASHPDRSCFDCRWYCVHPVPDPGANRRCLAELGVGQAGGLANDILQMRHEAGADPQSS